MEPSTNGASKSTDRAERLAQKATALFQQGRYRQAESATRRVLAIREEVLGSEHRDVCTTLNNLALLYVYRGRYAKAKPLFERSLVIAETTFGPLHPIIATTLDNLGVLYSEEGHYAEAEPLFKRSLAIRKKALGTHHPDVAHGLLNLARLYTRMGRLLEAKQLLKRAQAIEEDGPEDHTIASTLHSLGLVYAAEGHYAEAEPLFNRSLAIREKAFGLHHPLVAESLSGLAGLYITLGRNAEAEALFHRSLLIVETALGFHHPHFATLLYNLSGLYFQSSRKTGAEKLLKRSLAIRKRRLGHSHPEFASGLKSLATLHLAKAEQLAERCVTARETLGPQHPDLTNTLSDLWHGIRAHHKVAEKLLNDSLAVMVETLGPGHPDLAYGIDDLAQLNQRCNRYAQAEKLLKRGLAIRKKALGHQHPDIIESLSRLASLYRDQHRFSEAYIVSRRAVDILHERFIAINGSRSGGVDSERRRFRNMLLLQIALSHDQNNTSSESFHAAQLANASSVAQAVVGMAARFAAGSDGLAEVVRQRQDVAQRWEQLDGAITQAFSKPSSQRDAAVEESLRREYAYAGTRLKRLDVRLTREFPAYAELSNPRPLDVEGTQALLAHDEALLVYLVSQSATWLWVLRIHGVFLYGIDVCAETLVEEVRALRVRLDPEINHSLEPFPAGRAYALYKTILDPAISLLGDVNHLIVVPDGVLQSLPFSVLVTKPPNPDITDVSDHRAIAWLARDYAISVLPSVSSLSALRLHASTSKATAPFLGIGNPLAAHAYGLAPLPETADELRTIARTLGASESDLLLGDDAKGSVIRQTPLDRYRVIAFATHGLVPGELEGLEEPALVLTPSPKSVADDGLLTASKIATLRLDADWVILSACNTAGGDVNSDAAGFTGLAKAFFYAGARSLLVSHWPVLSAAAVPLTTGTFEALARDPSIGRAEALRRTMITMLDASDVREFAHPQAWAPFVVAGVASPK